MSPFTEEDRSVAAVFFSEWLCPPGLSIHEELVSGSRARSHLGIGKEWRCAAVRDTNVCPDKSSWNFSPMCCNCGSLSAALTSLVEELWFLLHVLVPLIFLLCQISEVSDYVSIKHILCPAINVLIAGEKENPLGAVNNGLLFIRGHSSEVGKTCNRALSFHTDDNTFKNTGWGLHSFNPANNKNNPNIPARRATKHTHRCAAVQRTQVPAPKGALPEVSVAIAIAYVHI